MGVLSEVIEKVKSHSKGCMDNVVDMRTVTFDSKEGEAFLKGEENTYYFKVDTLNPKDPKVVHGMKQFCRMIKIPFSFMFRSPDELRRHMTEVWLPSLKGEKAVVLFKLRTEAEKSDARIIRAVMPVECLNIQNDDMLEKVESAIGDDFMVQSVIGDGRDDLVLQIRLLYDSKFDAFGEECSLGFMIRMSELGAKPLHVDTFVYVEETQSCIAMDFGLEPFFEKKYEKAKLNEVEETLSKVVDFLKKPSTKASIRDSIQLAKESKRPPGDLIIRLRLTKGIPDPFVTALSNDVEGVSEISLWDFAKKMAENAKDFEITKCDRLEREAGIIVGFNTLDR